MDSKPAPDMQWLINKQNVSSIDKHINMHIYIYFKFIVLMLQKMNTIDISGYVEYGLANQNNHESEDNA